MSRSRRIVVALFALLGLALAVGSAAVWESFQPTVIELANPVEALALSADGESIAACGSDLAWIYTTAGGVHPAPHGYPPDTEKSWVPVGLVFSAKDDVIFGVDKTAEVRAWSRRDGARVELPPLAVEGQFKGASLSPRGDLVATQSHSAGLQLWSLPSGKLICTVTKEWMGWSGYAIGFTPSGERVFARHYRETHQENLPLLRVWSACDGRLVAKGVAWTEGPALDPGDLCLGDFSDGLHVFEISGRRERFFVPLRRPRAFAFSPDGELLAVGGDVVELHSATNGKLLRRLSHGESAPCSALAVSRNRHRLAAAFGRRIYLWRLRG